MSQKTAFLAGLLLSASLLSSLMTSPAMAADPLPPRAAWIPSNAVFVGELPHPKPLLDLATDKRLLKAVEASPVFQQRSAQAGFQMLRGVVNILQWKLNTDWQTGLHKLLDGGVTLALFPDGGRLLVVDAQDAHLLKNLNETIYGFVKGDAGKGNAQRRVASKEYEGVTQWTFGNGEAHAILEDRLLLADREATLHAALDLRSGKRGESLAQSARYNAARQAVDASAAGFVFVDLATVKQVPNIKRAIEQEQNPMATLLFAPLTDALKGSTWLAAKLGVERDGIELTATVDRTSGESALTAFARPPAGEGVLPNLSVPRQIAGLSFYRDLRGFYTAKDQLFPERTSGLIFFENMMGIFFSGRDLTNEVMAQFRPEIRFIVAAQEYDPAIGTPMVRFPGFAIVFRARDAKEFGEVIEEAWQKAVGIMNVGNGQKGLPGLVIDRDVHDGTRYSFAYYSTSRIDEKDRTRLPAQYNVRPALAKLKDSIIISSSDGLTKDLIDAIKKEADRPAKAIAGTNTLAKLDLVELNALLTANRPNLVRQNMVEKGNSKEKAEGEIGGLLAIAQRLGQARLTIDSRDGRPSARLELKLNLPSN